MRCGTPIHRAGSGAPELQPETPALPLFVQARVAVDALDALHAGIVTEADQTAYVSRVPAPLLGSAGGLVAFDLRDLFAEVPDEPFYLHLSARGWVSTPQRRQGGAGKPGQLAESAKTPLEQLYAAYALLRADDPVRAVPAFRAALEDPAAKADLDRPNFYNAACAVSRSAAKADAAVREKVLKNAVAWLDEDLALVQKRLAEIAAKLALTPADPARLLAQRALLNEHLDARRTDPDLNTLRESALWKARA